MSEALAYNTVTNVETIRPNQLRETSFSANRAKAKKYDQTKRALDILGASLLLVSLTPVLLLVAAAVRISSKGPILFKQTRLTKGNTEFTMVKFRTMRVDAEKNSGAVWAMKNDSRVTRIGKFLRKTRLDELPQLVNVIKGEMSLIGPRPERPELVSELEAEFPQFRQRLAVKAGLSGLAQVQAGYADSVDTYREKLRLDLEYVEHRSLMLDARIAVQTIFVVVFGTGAR